MADCAEADADFSWESCWASPGKTKTRKKDSKKDKKGEKRKSSVALNNDGSIQKKKKKKNCKFKEAMKDKKKEKKKKKKKTRAHLGLDDSFLLTQVNGTLDPVAQRMRPEQTPADKPAESHPGSCEKPKPDQPTCNFLPKQKKTKPKKKVAFDLSPGCIRAKRPTIASPPPQSPKDRILLESEAARDSEILLRSLGPPQDNDSQCTADDTNSQDLFITQKTFRTSSSEPSSGETNEEDAATPPDRESHSPLTQRTQRHEGSDTIPQAQNKLPHSQKHPRKANLEVGTLLVNKTDELDTSHRDPKKIELRTNLTEETKAKAVNSYLQQPMAVNTYLDAKPQKDFFTSSQKIQRLLPPMLTANTSTQTENFFTTELSSYLGFCQGSRATRSCEDLKPLDLSLPQRARADLGGCLLFSVKTSVIEIEDEGDADQKPSPSPTEITDDDDKDISERPSFSSEVKDGKGMKEPHGQPLWCSTKRRDQTTPSSQSESEPKSSDTTTSSEDNEPSWRSSKLDMSQVRAVQMRLNESFFFKTKGEGESPRAESPLMKLTQSREKKSRKRH